VSVGAVLVEGAGGYFCSGADTRLLATSSADPASPAAVASTSAVYRSFTRVGSLPVPTLALVTGGAVGAGMNLALATDLLLVTPDAVLDSGFLARGIHPGGGHLALLGRRIGYQRAAATALLGRPLSGAEAVAHGLAYAAYGAEELLPAALDLVALAAKDPELTRRIKQSLTLELAAGPVPWPAAGLSGESATQPDARAHQGGQLHALRVGGPRVLDRHRDVAEADPVGRVGEGERAARPVVPERAVAAELHLLVRLHVDDAKAHDLVQHPVDAAHLLLRHPRDRARVEQGRRPGRADRGRVGPGQPPGRADAADRRGPGRPYLAHVGRGGAVHHARAAHRAVEGERGDPVGRRRAPVDLRLLRAGRRHRQHLAEAVLLPGREAQVEVDVVRRPDRALVDRLQRPPGDPPGQLFHEHADGQPVVAERRARQ